MEKESFENEEISNILNENFVSIKVDREERPDVDQVYMTFIQVSSLSTGRCEILVTSQLMYQQNYNCLIT